MSRLQAGRWASFWSPGWVRGPTFEEPAGTIESSIAVASALPPESTYFCGT